MVLQEIKEAHQRGHCVLKVAGKSLNTQTILFTIKPTQKNSFN